MGEDHTYRYVNTNSVPNSNSGTYTANSRGASLDMGATNTYRYVNTNSVPNSNSSEYTFPANDTGAKKDMGATNSYRYVTATNVYDKGKADGATVHSGTYTFASGDTGGTKDLGTSHTYRYVNAGNVYTKGKADGTVSDVTNLMTNSISGVTLYTNGVTKTSNVYWKNAPAAGAGIYIKNTSGSTLLVFAPVMYDTGTSVPTPSLPLFSTSVIGDYPYWQIGYGNTNGILPDMETTGANREVFYLAAGQIAFTIPNNKTGYAGIQGLGPYSSFYIYKGIYAKKI